MFLKIHKTIKVFTMSYLCQFGKMVKIWSLVRKIEYRQAFFIYVPGDIVNKVEVTKIL